MQVEGEDKKGPICFLPVLKPLLDFMKSKNAQVLTKYAESLTSTRLAEVSHENLVMFLYLFKPQID